MSKSRNARRSWVLLWSLALASLLAAGARADDPWVVYEGTDGPGKGKNVVLVSGDEEYRSEEALPQLARILAKRHGFRCTVLFAIGNEGAIDPNRSDNIPGLEALDSADLMVIATRFRDLPDDQMKHVVDYVESGRPVIGMRTATHAFNLNRSKTYAHYSWTSKAKGWEGGFGRQVLGETWVNHHGHHGKESTRGIIAPGAQSHPVLRGIKDGDVWGPTDVYEVHLPLPGDSRPLVLGEVLEGMSPTDKPLPGKKNDPMMPVAWVKTFTGKSGKAARVFTTTMGAGQDLESEGVRRMLVNACYWAVGLEDAIPEKTPVELVGEYKPRRFGFGGFEKGVKPGFDSLFDGKTLDGWKKVGGGATYHVEGDAIVGEVGPGANTFLRTEATYGDFVLELDAKLDVPGNSGIQFRSHQQGGDGRVFGYQCEIDPTPRAWTAGIYDEGRRGWLFPLTGHPEAQKAFKLDDWNHFVIEARGPELRTWLNGVPCADLVDTADLEGFLALQVHAGKQGRIRWRNVRLKDLGRHHWRPLWDGKTFEGWEPIGGGHWAIEEGTIHGTSSSGEPRHGHLITRGSFDDLAVRLKFLAKEGNSGLYFRVEEGGGAGVKGFQAEIDPANDVGGLYETEGRAWVVQPKAEDVKTWLKPGAWNEMSVVALGDRIVVHVNGRKTAEIHDKEGRKRGRIALQLHGGQDMDVRFKDVEILERDGPGKSPRP